MNLLETAARGVAGRGLGGPEIDNLRLLARTLMGLGRAREAEQHLTTAHRLAAAKGLSWHRREIRMDLARLRAADGALVETDRPLHHRGPAATSAPPPEHGYLIRERIGGGTFGEVFRGYDLDSAREVAIKRLSFTGLYDVDKAATIIASVERELDAARRVEHPGVACVYGLNRSGGGEFHLVQEFIEGPSLRERMTAEPRPDPHAVARIVVRIAQPLAAIHRAGVIHRDLKPENVILRHGRDPVIIDFGIAHVDHPGAAPAPGLGTPAYMPPEQAAGRRLDARCDIFALGTIILEWLSGLQADDPDAAPLRRVARRMAHPRRWRRIEFIAVLPLPLPEGTTLEAVSGLGPSRDACYGNLGTFLAERSHVLVAIWDGVDNGKPGGTASVVKARTEPTSRPGSLAWRELLPNDVVHVRAGRTSTAPAHAPGSRGLLRPPRAHEPQRSRHEDDEVTSRIDAFNRDVDRLGGLLAAGFDESGRYLLAGPLPPPRAGTAGSLRDHFAAFDRLAIHWQQAATRSLSRLHVLIWVAVLCFELFTNFDAVLNPFLSNVGIDASAAGSLGPLVRSEIFIVYFLLVGVAWAVALWANRGRQQPRHLDYRSIAEAVRMQFFWRLAGLDRTAAAEFLASQMSVLAWMRSAVATVTLVADARHPDERAAAPSRALRVVNRGLCLGQLRYFRKAALRDARLLGRRQRLIAILFAAGLAATVALGLTGFTRFVALESLAAILFVSAGLLATHTETLALDEHINQYSGMAYLYAAARRAIVRALRAGDLDRARGVIAEVGEEALGENASWVLLHRNRPLRVPQA